MDGGQTLTLRAVTRHHAGKYRCHASNGVGQDAAEEIHLQVLCKCRIVSTALFIHSVARFWKFPWLVALFCIDLMPKWPSQLSEKR